MFGLDNGGYLHDSLGMRMMKSFVLILSMFVMLPWGAYAGSVLTPALISEPAPRYAAPDSCAENSDATVHAKPATEVVKPRECRIAILPASSCGPDRALTNSVFSHDVDRVRRRVARSEDRMSDSLARSPPRTPPRFS